MKGLHGSVNLSDVHVGRTINDVKKKLAQTASCWD